MTKLELLNVFLNDRLTAAADDIFTAIKNTVVEYQSEILRSKEENERLKRLLNIAVQRLLLYSEPFSIQHREDGHSSEAQSCQDDWRPLLGHERPECQPPTPPPPTPPPPLPPPPPPPSPPEMKEKLEPEFIHSEPAALSGEDSGRVECPGRAVPSPPPWDGGSGLLSPEHIKVESDGGDIGRRSPLLPSPACSLSLTRRPHGDDGERGDPMRTTEPVPRRAAKTAQTLRGRNARSLRQPPAWSSSSSTTTSATSPSSTTQAHHQRAPGGQKCHCCRECGKRFSFACQLEVHVRWHTKEKPYGCAVCRKSFTTVSMLKRHHRIHTGEKPFHCHVCGKCFNQSAHLNTHFRLHARADRWRRGEPLSK